MSANPEFDAQYAAFLRALPKKLRTYAGQWAAYRNGEWRFHADEWDALDDAVRTWGDEPFVIARVEMPRVVKMHDVP